MKIASLIFSLLIFLYVSMPSYVIAQEMEEKVQEIDIVATQEAQINYELPYPGVLPDNPLHFLKAARDRLVAMLINDPVKKAEFNLLTSDKRIYAARLLAEKGKGEMAVDTLSKSNNYFHQAIGAVSEAKKMGRNVDTVLRNLENSVKKHKEVIEMIDRKIGKEFSSQLQAENKRVLEFEKSVKKFSSKK